MTLFAPRDSPCLPRSEELSRSSQNYVAQSAPFTDQVTAESVGIAYPAITEKRLGDLWMYFPPSDEQTAIVRYLDEAGEKIQAYISAKQRLIALLEEQRQTDIHQAVTRGLDPNVKMKPSGVEWLGEVPEHWDSRDIKSIAIIKRGKFSHRPRNDPSFYDGPYPFIQTGDIATAGLLIKEFKQTLNQKGLAVSTIFPNGTLVMTIAANIGDVAILNFDACVPDSIVGIIPIPSTDRNYLYYLLRAMKHELLREAPVNTQGNPQRRPHRVNESSVS